MGRVSPHFERSEFCCRCHRNCGNAVVDIELLEILEKIRTHFGKPVVITSGNRCLQHNRECESKDTSQHIKGMAVDIKVKGHSPQEVYDYVNDNIDPNGLGIYDTFCHIDVRYKRRARWDKRR